MCSKPEDWDALANSYEADVYSITKPLEKRTRIIADIEDGNEVLVVGCGSEIHLQSHMLRDKSVNVIAADFSPEMLAVSKSKYSHSGLRHVEMDTREIPFRDRFDKVVSTNSIIPPLRADVVRMYQSIHRCLVPGGKLLAYLPSFDLCEALAEYSELKAVLEPLMDRSQSRFQDTVGWQCFHSRNLILKELSEGGFAVADIEIITVGCESDAEAEDLSRLYGFPADLFRREFSIFYVRAKKQGSIGNQL